MSTPFLRAVRGAVAVSTLLPLIATVCSRSLPTGQGQVLSVVEIAAHLSAVVLLNVLLGRLIDRWRRPLDELSERQVQFLDGLPEARASLAILASAGASLFLELALIRWQGSVFELFALYKNLGLLACFAGLGLGYALAGRDRIPLAWTIPLVAWQMLLLVFLRHGLAGPAIETNGYSWRIQSLLATPVAEQRNIGFAVAESLPQFAAAYALLVTVFLLTALALLPVGQLCGRTMRRRSQLQAYGLNLLGSLAGVVLLLGASAVWSPPIAWFAPLFTLLLLFQSHGGRSLVGGILASAVALVVLAWPVNVGWERIYSPYQLIERGPGVRGLTLLRAAGHYYQKVFDLSPEAQQASAEGRRVAFYYELPYRVHGKPRHVAILGAGTGNDVAAALRAGAERVDAVEIDPVILRLGVLYHPERPYDDPRVKAVVDDARAWLRTTRESYDMIVYGLLDSHTLLSHASSVRLESFVYTVEALREARTRLEEGGTLSLSFAVVSKEIGRKILLMMTEAFDGSAPVCLRGAYEGSVIFIQKKEGGLTLPPDLTLDRGEGFWVMDRFGDASVRADVSTDDWPFLYMATRAYPRTYLFLAVLILTLSAALAANFVREGLSVSHGVFFFLGAAFMLLETKAITELGLVFGNTWQVVGISIAGILAMAYAATWFVERARPRTIVLPFVLLLLSLGAGLAVARAGGFAPTLAGRAAVVAVLSAPVFFSGVLFARFLLAEADVAPALAVNLLGALFGGLLEYNALYFGFRFLYGLTASLYGAALLAALARRRRVAPG